jgi:hypothetical protein
LAAHADESGIELRQGDIMNEIHKRSNVIASGEKQSTRIEDSIF